MNPRSLAQLLWVAILGWRSIFSILPVHHSHVQSCWQLRCQAHCIALLYDRGGIAVHVLQRELTVISITGFGEANVHLSGMTRIVLIKEGKQQAQSRLPWAAGSSGLPARLMSETP